jgi:metallo-beta-lactamase family protein
MVDCSLFQSLKPLQNWEPLPIDPKSLDGVVLTHAHLDHSGYLPLLSKNGFRGPIWCTQSTADLCRILLPDSGCLQERDAESANQHGYSKHNPALPLYSEADARATLELFRSIPFTLMHTLHAGVAITFRRTGNILGAASVEFGIDDLKIVFSGDVGRYGDPIFRDPDAVSSADYLIVESNYGDRLHDSADPAQMLEEVVLRNASRGGTFPGFRRRARADRCCWRVQR